MPESELNLDFDMPITVAGGDQPSTVPLPSGDYWRNLVRHPATSSNGQSATVSARIPLEWAEAITLLRDWSKSAFPAREIWPGTSDFVRSALAAWIYNVSQMRDAAERGNLPDNSSTGLMAAQLFVESIGGELGARGRTMAKAQVQAHELARTIRDLMNRKEPAEAADMVSRWVEGTFQIRDQSGSDFWERFFITSLFRIPTVIEDVKDLIDGQFIVDENIIANIEHVFDLIENGDLDLSHDVENNVSQFPAADDFIIGDTSDNRSTS